MRPERLELEGFTAFRHRTEVDFRGADLFALTGPTGAGKSSLIDAITFALYGSVARYEDDRLVAPVISQGQAEARVALDFAVGDEHYRAVRVVRTTPRGRATTKEARLERRPADGADGDGVLLAGDAKEVTAEVERLLGLGFRQLTTCAVLPQGQFARFLHAKPSERADLLVQLLELGLYTRIGELAHLRATDAKVRAERAAGDLERLAFATDDARAQVAARIDDLTALRDRVERAQPDLEALQRAVEEASAQAAGFERRQAELEGLVVPDGVEQVAARAALAREEAAQAGRDLEAGDLVVDQADQAAQALPSLAELQRERDRRQTHQDLTARIEKGAVVVAELRQADDAARSARDDAATTVAAARDALEQARRADRAADLRGHLHEGEPCPVCAQVVAVVPPADRSQVDAAEAAVQEAEAAHRRADDAQRDAERRRTKAEGHLEDLQQQHDAAARALEGARDAAALDAAVAGREAADADLVRARDAAKEARRVRDATEQRRRDAEDQERTLRDRWLHQHARLQDVGSGPPPERGDDLAADWEALVAWAAKERPALERQAGSARTLADQQGAQHRRLLAEVHQACLDAGLDPGTRPARDACVDALAAARPELARIDAGLADRKAAEAEHERAQDQAQVADALHRLLNARNFRAWVLDEVLDRLVEGATDVLHNLSGGAYSLLRDERGEFAVVDHANADARRSARTLSGGETFLASLALALALADRVADLSPAGAQRLEAIFLDEGFGTLDPDSLDVVAGALEELGAQGRAVGVVTHVRELAERLPVRFEVRKGPEGASVERVDT